MKKTFVPRPLLLTVAVLAAGALLVTSLAPSSLPVTPVRVQAVGPGALLLNGDFSHGQTQPDHWLLHPAEGTIAEAALDQVGARSAPSCLRIEVTGGAVPNTPGRAALMQPFSHVPAHEVTSS